MADDQANQADPLQEYVDKLIDEKNFPDLTDDLRDQIRQDVFQRLNDFIIARTVAALSDEAVGEFNQMLDDNKSDEELQAFVKEEIDNYDEFLAKTLLEFRKSYLGIA